MGCRPLSGSRDHSVPDGVSRRNIVGASFGISLAMALAGSVKASGDDVPTTGAGTGKLLSGVQGTVNYEDGAPVAGAVIVAEALPGTEAAVPEIGVKTSPDGHYAWPLPTGSFKLSVMIDGVIVGAVKVSAQRGSVITADIEVKR